AGRDRLQGFQKQIGRRKGYQRSHTNGEQPDEEVGLYRGPKFAANRGGRHSDVKLSRDGAFRRQGLAKIVNSGAEEQPPKLNVGVLFVQLAQIIRGPLNHIFIQRKIVAAIAIRYELSIPVGKIEISDRSPDSYQ